MDCLAYYGIFILQLCGKYENIFIYKLYNSDSGPGQQLHFSVFTLIVEWYDQSQ